LSQWRGYAQRGEGYCLGFEFSSVTRIASNLDNLNNAKEPYLRKVIYLPTKQKELVSSYLSSLLPAVQAALSSSRLPKQDSMTNVTIMAIQSASILLDMLFSFKHPAFVSEQEWRLVWVTRNDFEPQGVNFRERLGQLIPYRPVYIFDNLAESSRSFPLRSIGFGPLLEPLRTRATLQLLLQRMSKAVHPISIQPSFEIFEAGFSLRPG
jgi:hypothetical protein